MKIHEFITRFFHNYEGKMKELIKICDNSDISAVRKIQGENELRQEMFSDTLQNFAECICKEQRLSCTRGSSVGYSYHTDSKYIIHTMQSKIEDILKEEF